MRGGRLPRGAPGNGADVGVRRSSAAVALRALLAAVLCLAPAAGPLAAQEPEDVRLGIEYTPSFLPGLVVLPAETGAGAESVAARIDSILVRDLDYSDRFELMPVPDSVAGSGPVNYALWNRLGAVWLLSAHVSGSEAVPVLRLSLHDVVFGELKEVRAFALPGAATDRFRMAVHRAADEVVRWATGTPGVAATRVVFRRKLPEGSSDIFIVDSDGHGLRRLTRDSSIVYSPELAPDGRHLVYSSYVAGGPAVYEKDLATGEVRTISAEPGLNITPAYSPDGRWIAFGRSIDGHTEVFEVQVRPLCCGRRITYTSAGDALNPVYSPDGRRIAFTASALGLPHVYVTEREGGAPRIVSRYVFGERGYADSPDWSPVDDRLAYQAWIENAFQIVTAAPDGGDRRVLTSRGSNENPSWAPDGRHLVFASTSGRPGLLILDTVSGRVRRLTTGSADEMPSWSEPVAPAP